jgi:hypothetical protein
MGKIFCLIYSIYFVMDGGAAVDGQGYDGSRAGDRISVIDRIHENFFTPQLVARERLVVLDAFCELFSHKTRQKCRLAADQELSRGSLPARRVQVGDDTDLCLG